MTIQPLDDTRCADAGRRCAGRRCQRRSVWKHAFARSGFCQAGRRAVEPAKPQVTSGARPVSVGGIVGSLRFYDPTTAQFLTRDPAVGMTRQAYSYVGGNPLNRVDPSGLWELPLPPGATGLLGLALGIDCVGSDCNSIAEQNPEISQGVADAAGGALMVNPFAYNRFTEGSFHRFLDNNGVNRNSFAFASGGACMELAGLVGGGRSRYGNRGVKPPLAKSFRGSDGGMSPTRDAAVAKAR